MGWPATAAQLLGFPIAWVALLYWQQDSLIYHPVGYSGPFDASVWDPEFDVRELHFATQDGNQTALLATHHAATPSHVYLVFGGNAMVARDWLDVVWSLLSATSDVAFVLVDYPGYGDSAGSPSQASIGRASAAALSEALEALPAAPSAAGMAVGALGHSIGCAAALQLAVMQRGGPAALQHLVLSAPFTNLALQAKEFFPPLKLVPTWLIAMLTSRNSWDNLAAAEQLAGEAGLRVDIIHGTYDSMIPQAMGRELFARFESLGVRASFESAKSDHNDLLSTEPYLNWLVGAVKPTTSS